MKYLARICDTGRTLTCVKNVIALRRPYTWPKEFTMFILIAYLAFPTLYSLIILVLCLLFILYCELSKSRTMSSPLHFAIYPSQYLIIILAEMLVSY